MHVDQIALKPMDNGLRLAPTPLLLLPPDRSPQGLKSSSGANATMSYDAKLRWWTELAERVHAGG